MIVPFEQIVSRVYQASDLQGDSISSVCGIECISQAWLTSVSDICRIQHHVCEGAKLEGVVTVTGGSV